MRSEITDGQRNMLLMLDNGDISRPNIQAHRSLDALVKKKYAQAFVIKGALVFEITKLGREMAEIIRRQGQRRPVETLGTPSVTNIEAEVAGNERP